MSLTIDIPDTFNGPLDLLLHLIKRDEMDIYDINVARLATSYLEEMGKLDIVDVDEATEFYDLASRLLEIKSRMLIPPEDREDDEEGEDEDFDPRSGLVEALLEYRRFKDVARMLGEMAEEQARRYPRVAPRMEFSVVPGEAETADCMDLFTAFQTMLMRIPDSESNVITYTEVPTSVRIEQMETVLRESKRTRFSLLLSGAPTRREMVGFFIAMLEMIRQGRLIARQADNFSDIILEPREPETPKAAARPATQNRRVTACFPATPMAAKRPECPGPAPVFPLPAPFRRREKSRNLRIAFCVNCRC